MQIEDAILVDDDEPPTKMPKVEKEYTFGYFAGLQLNEADQKQYLYYFPKPYYTVDPANTNPEQDEEAAKEFVHSVHEYISTVTLPRRKSSVQLANIFKKSEHGDYFATKTNGREVPLEKVHKSMIDEFITTCGYEIPQQPKTKVKKEIKRETPAPTSAPRATDAIDMVWKREGKDVPVRLTLKKEEEGIFHLPTDVGAPKPVPNNVKPFKRKLICNVYHGGTQKTFPSPDQKKHPGAERYACFKFDYNPDLPTRPGEHGYCMTKKKDIRLQKIWPVYIEQPHNYWLYLGHYTVDYQSEIPASDWYSLSQKTRNTWIDGTLTKKWGVDLLRQAGLTEKGQQTYENVNHAYETGKITLSLRLLSCQYFDEKYYQKLVDAEAEMPVEEKPRNKSKAK